MQQLQVAGQRVRAGVRAEQTTRCAVRPLLMGGMGRVFDIAHIREAHAVLEQGTGGKIVVTT
ncbi:hypothetical protein GIS00_04595 [Nakamurella sp. YIM 132087]|uniref:Zinc-binding dehydrogenase n=1 Tax=Nakamurella alba TaxID=2665158 RepID=A0A7K1FGH2_9ACTN|nr:hypothetical protein [Nakamurella alba]MTD13225.1 hypothetical protein [Nakamurella alba]